METYRLSLGNNAIYEVSCHPDEAKKFINKYLQLIRVEEFVNKCETSFNEPFLLRVNEIVNQAYENIQRMPAPKKIALGTFNTPNLNSFFNFMDIMDNFKSNTQ